MLNSNSDAPGGSFDSIGSKVKDCCPTATQAFPMGMVAGDENPRTQALRGSIQADLEADQSDTYPSSIKLPGEAPKYNSLVNNEAVYENAACANLFGSNIISRNGGDSKYNLIFGATRTIMNPPTAANMAHLHPTYLQGGVCSAQASLK